MVVKLKILFQQECSMFKTRQRTRSRDNNLSRILYNLYKRQKERAEFVLLLESSFNPDTGMTDKVVERYPIDIVVLDEDVMREIGQSMGHPIGGFYDEGARVIIVDANKLRKEEIDPVDGLPTIKSLELDKKMNVELHGENYTIETLNKIQSGDHVLAYTLKIKDVKTQ